MRNVHPCIRPVLETVNSKVEKLIGRRVLFDPLHPMLQEEFSPATYWRANLGLPDLSFALEAGTYF